MQGHRSQTAPQHRRRRESARRSPAASDGRVTFGNPPQKITAERVSSSKQAINVSCNKMRLERRLYLALSEPLKGVRQHFKSPFRLVLIHHQHIVSLCAHVRSLPLPPGAWLVYSHTIFIPKPLPEPVSHGHRGTFRHIATNGFSAMKRRTCTSQNHSPNHSPRGKGRYHGSYHPSSTASPPCNGSWMCSCLIPVYSPLLHISSHLVLEAISASISSDNCA